VPEELMDERLSRTDEFLDDAALLDAWWRASDGDRGGEGAL